MSHEYLVSSLPLLFFGDPPPFTVEVFRARCAGPLGPDERRVLDRVTEGRAEEAAHPFAQAWVRAETQLRNEAARVRAARRGVDAAPFQRSHAGYSMAIHQAVSDAFEKPDPLEREQTLDRGRWALLDELVGQDRFGLGAVLAYALKLRIAERWAGMTGEAGAARLEELLAAAVDGGAGAVPAADASGAGEEGAGARQP